MVHLPRLPQYYAGRARERTLAEDDKFAHRCVQCSALQHASRARGASVRAHACARQRGCGSGGGEARPAPARATLTPPRPLAPSAPRRPPPPRARSYQHSHSHAAEMAGRRQRYAQLVGEMFGPPGGGGGGGGGEDGGGQLGLLQAGVDWDRLHALEAEAALRAATVTELETDSAAHGAYAQLPELERTDRQTELSRAYVAAIKAKLALAEAIPELPAVADGLL